MVWSVLGVVLVVLVVAGPAHRALGARRARAPEAVDRFRIGRKLAAEEVSVFGEQLAELHVDALGTELDPALRADHRADHRAALHAYEQAKRQLAEATVIGDVNALLRTLTEGRFARARVLARRAGQAPPTRREQCFFNPQHGPSATDVAWAPAGGVMRQVAVCQSDAHRLANGQLPLVRVVATSGGLVPWYSAGPWLAGAPGTSRAHLPGGNTGRPRLGPAVATARPLR